MGFSAGGGGGGRWEEEGMVEVDDFLRICGSGGGGAGSAVAQWKRASAALRVGVSGTFLAGGGE